MSRVTMIDIYKHPITQKYVRRSGLAHAIRVADIALELARERNVDVDLAVKAGFLHDMGHYLFYKNGKWDFEEYRTNDIHAIKGAERAHKLLIRLGEDPSRAKEVSMAVLLHTDSYLPAANIQRTPLQQVVADADELDEEPSGRHHYRTITEEEAFTRLSSLDDRLEQAVAEAMHS
ncbi:MULTISPECIES: HD domain-containing protein [Marinococcus]|uniref:HD domain-containing protein n=1 Tax=Marinococcus TaxID=1370 RepID=UPI0003B3D33B|nr:MULTISPECIES: HD domain-containing protein [Marinococcus]MDX6152159.1 HD domain-containing protein [Marinococcus sp. PL1-022]